MRLYFLKQLKSASWSPSFKTVILYYLAVIRPILADRTNSSVHATVLHPSICRLERMYCG